jgi:hypothetical protein
MHGSARGWPYHTVCIGAESTQVWLAYGRGVEAFGAFRSLYRGKHGLFNS